MGVGSVEKVLTGAEEESAERGRREVGSVERRPSGESCLRVVCEERVL